MTAFNCLQSQDKYRRQFYKTSLCKYHLANTCSKGDTCSHAHSPSELTNKPILSKTRMCKSALRSGECLDPRCEFAHDLPELTAANTFFRTKMCDFYLSGHCKLGEKCRYAHEGSQLQLDPVSEIYSPAPVVVIPPVDLNDSPDTGYPMKRSGSSRSTVASSSFGSFSALHQGAAPAGVYHLYPMMVYPQQPAVFQYQD
jgi:hypothetical protein